MSSLNISCIFYGVGGTLFKLLTDINPEFYKMKKKDIPQDKSHLKGFSREVFYAKNEKGEYEAGPSLCFFEGKGAAAKVAEDK